MNLSDSIKFVTPKIALSDDVSAETRNQILVHIINNAGLTVFLQLGYNEIA